MKLDIGCGATCLDGYVGVDYKKYGDHIKYIVDLNKQKLPFEDNSIDEIHCAHTLEHLDSPFDVLDEFKRVLKPEAKCIIKVPYCRHYQAFHPHHKTYWGMCEHNLIGGAYEEFTTGHMPWTKVSVDHTWQIQGEDILFAPFIPLLDWVIKNHVGIYERKISYIFPVYELIFTCIK